MIGPDLGNRNGPVGFKPRSWWWRLFHTQTCATFVFGKHHLRVSARKIYPGWCSSWPRSLSR